MLTVAHLSKSYGARTLFRGVSFHVKASDRIGLVGPNGSGKSTLFRLILGDLESDEGTVAFRNRVAVGYLPQEIEPSGHETVLELATTVSPEITTLRNTLRTQQPDSEAWHATQSRLDEWRLYELEPKAKRILAGLAFRQSDFQRPTGTLSGGWIMRAHLARLLVQEPGLLMLDEPTNHLDIESLIWFQDYLRTYPGAILMISHDRELLNQLVGSIFEIAQTRIIRYRGNYDAYVTQRAMRQEQQWAAYKNQQKEIEALQQFADRFRAKATKASQAQSKLKQIERMEKIEAPAVLDRTIAFHWPQPPRTGLKVATLTDVHQAYGPVLVYQGLNLSVERGQRTVLVGPNGSGKSTLLKLLAGAIPVQGGSRELGLHVKVGYYAQHRIDMLNAGRTVLAEVLDASHPVGEQTARSVLGSFLFRGDDVFKRVSVLSGGEKSRLALVKLLLNPPNFLLMDEPTTHLDMASIEALIGALRQYKGTLLFISHDVYFIRSIATTVLHIHAGRLTPYAGNYQYYLDRSQALSERGALTAGSQLADGRPAEPGVPTRKTQRRLEAETRQACSKRRRENEKKRSGLEADIERFETQQKTLAAQLENPETYTTPGKPMELNRELTQVVESLKILYAEWDQVATSND
ncbi:MAG: ABC-F family ATP-binding cassette domain-containing protein [Kiritimatiellaeota bacterium]|nr:ABC-F family ATP-binding cassette domain-containing protein [Kiritimatiellota bacterium]